MFECFYTVLIFSSSIINSKEKTIFSSMAINVLTKVVLQLRYNQLQFSSKNYLLKLVRIYREIRKSLL